jgi:hypothetical protein
MKSSVTNKIEDGECIGNVFEEFAIYNRNGNNNSNIGETIIPLSLHLLGPINLSWVTLGEPQIPNPDALTSLSNNMGKRYKAIVQRLTTSPASSVSPANKIPGKTRLAKCMGSTVLSEVHLNYAVLDTSSSYEVYRSSASLAEITQPLTQYMGTPSPLPTMSSSGSAQSSSSKVSPPSWSSVFRRVAITNASSALISPSTRSQLECSGWATPQTIDKPCGPQSLVNTRHHH